LETVEELTLYSLHGCPYCAAVRMRLGELGLSYRLLEVPARRADRTEVREVSGQETVPVMVVRRPGAMDQVFADENDILQYLERRHPTTTHQAAEGTWDDAATQRLAVAVRAAQEAASELRELYQQAAAAGATDRANCLSAAAKHAELAKRWSERQLDLLQPM